MSAVGNEIKKLGLMKAYEFLDRNPEANLPKLLDWFDTYAPKDVLSVQRDVIRDIVTRKDGNWYNLLISLWSDIDDDVRKTIFENMLINANALAAPQANENREKYGCNIPWVIALNINGSGDRRYLDFDEWDDVIEQAKALGTFMFFIEGEEPLKYPEEIIALCNKHYECEFLMFTDGMGITEEFADEMLRVKNLIVAVEVSGTPEDQKLAETAEILHRKKLPYCVSCTYDEESQDRFDREDFFDKMIENGVKLCLFFSAAPAGKDRVYDRIVEYRKKKPIMTINFCKDSTITGGCVAGGRYYCSISATGDVEACFFYRESDSNVREKSLVECLQSPLFMKFHDKNVQCVLNR